MKVAYDLDGVLAVAPPPNVKKWGLMNGAERRARVEFLEQHYKAAKVILRPSEKFWVISARKESARAVSEAWLARHFGSRFQGLFLLNTSRSTDNVVEFKSRVILREGFRRFTEDNLTVIRRINRRCADCCACYYFDGVSKKLVLL